MQQEAECCFESGESIVDRVYLREGNSLSTDFLPVKIGNSMPGLVVSFMNASRIQQMESQIRRQMSDKGLAARYTFRDIVHKSDIMDKTIENAGRYAGVSSNVLLVGETGTGKELLPRAYIMPAKGREILLWQLIARHCRKACWKVSYLVM